LTATFSCKFSRSLGKQELMRMFNNTYRRTYSYPPANINMKIITSGPIIVNNNNTFQPTTVLTPNERHISSFNDTAQSLYKNNTP